MMRRIVVRVVAAAALAAGVAACKVTGLDGCIIGPCSTSGPVGVYPITLVTGFPSSRVSGSTGLFAPGDTVRLSVVRVPSTALPCAAGDTVRDSVRWASTDPTVATITTTPEGQALVTARAAGSFHILMLVGGTTPLDPALPPQYVTICPTGGLIADFQVNP
jgi:hypothetical protein